MKPESYTLDMNPEEVVELAGSLLKKHGNYNAPREALMKQGFCKNHVEYILSELERAQVRKMIADAGGNIS